MTTMDDETLRAILDGLRSGPVHITANRCTGDSRAVSAFCDLVRVAPDLAAEVLRLRERVALRDDAADAFDALVRRVWEAATGDTHEGPASVDVLLEAVAGLRTAARAHLAADDALSVARRTDAADVPTAEARALAARECLAGLVGYAPGEVGR